MRKKIKQPLFLCGMMGAGKSTSGKPLSKKLEVPFFDLDQMIEEHEQMTIPKIFETKGEEYFRGIEKKLLIAQTDEMEGVMALGGGALQNQLVVDHIKLNGWLVYLNPSIETILERLQQTAGRPMISGENVADLKTRIHTLMQERDPFYNQAHITVKTATLSPDETADLIIKKLSFYEQ
jgi:shikimate kinase